MDIIVFRCSLDGHILHYTLERNRFDQSPRTSVHHKPYKGNRRKAIEKELSKRAGHPQNGKSELAGIVKETGASKTFGLRVNTE